MFKEIIENDALNINSKKFVENFFLIIIKHLIDLYGLPLD